MIVLLVTNLEYFEWIVVKWMDADTIAEVEDDDEYDNNKFEFEFELVK